MASTIITLEIRTPTKAFRVLGSLGRAENGSLTDPRTGRDVDCAGYRWHADFATNDLVTSIPRSCIGRPDWVRVWLEFRHWERTMNSAWIELDYGTGRKGSLGGPYSPRVYAG